MALPELATMQQMYELLHELDPRARQRALKWVKAALDAADAAPAAADGDTPEAVAPDTAEAADEQATGTGAAPTSPVDPTPAVAATPVEPDADAAPVAEVTGDQATEPLAEKPAAVAAGRGRATKVAPAGPARKRAAKVAAKKATAPAPTAGTGRGRPPAENIMAAYQEVGGSLTALAEHYGKPYATIQGWARVLRGQGYQIGRSRKS